MHWLRPSIAALSALVLFACDDARRATGSNGRSLPELNAVEVVATSRGTIGEWSPVMSWPGIAIHAHVLPNGRVFTWGGENNEFHQRANGQPTVLWDPRNPSVFSEGFEAGTDIFCSGHAFLPDGRLLVTGGHIDNTLGVANANIFDYTTGSWTPAANMNAGRWYPTTLALSSGAMLVIGGTDEGGRNNTLPQIFTNGTWRSLTTAQLAMDYYPWMHLAPNGRVFNSGPRKTTRYLNTSGTGSWTVVGSSNFGYRDYGSAVMYQPGKVLIVGGGSPPTNTAEVINLTATPPAWRLTGSMAFRRRQLNATLLPDGKVLVTGGTSGSGFNDESSPVYAAELWNPATGSWTTLASMQTPRLYHSTALLLPDGRVLSAGGGRCDGRCTPQRNAEIFSPPYLFNPDGTNAVRPTISDAPATIGYGQTFFVGTPDVARIGRVTMIRLPSVTHSFDENQRFNGLSFTKTTNGLNVKAPGGRTGAPPGHYMMFILTGKGVPSAARIIQLR